jgi:hypothetical protein
MNETLNRYFSEQHAVLTGGASDIGVAIGRFRLYVVSEDEVPLWASKQT